MINELHLMDNQKGIAKLADKSVNLIIADPPYYKIKGDFDFEFKDFQEYLNFMEEQAKLYKRVLADNGSLFVYGHAKNIAYVQVIFDKYFKLENSLVWEKEDCQTNIGASGFRSFTPITERILFYSNEKKENKCAIIHKDLFSSLISKINETAKIEDFIKCLMDLGIASNLNSAKVLATYKLGKHATRYDFLSEDMYNYIGNFNYTYEELRKEYEELRRTFNNTKKLTDVMRYSQETYLSRQFDHDTIKPEKLTLDLIETTTKENDLVLIPFGGSGTECVCCMRLKRQWIAFENKKKYFDIASKRILSEYEKTSLFNSLGGRQVKLSA